MFTKLKHTTHQHAATSGSVQPAVFPTATQNAGGVHRVIPPRSVKPPLPCLHEVSWEDIKCLRYSQLSGRTAIPGDGSLQGL